VIGLERDEDLGVLRTDVVGGDEAGCKKRMPMLSLSLLQLAGGDDLPDLRSASSTSRSVSVIRVPMGARKWSRIKPASTSGKKSSLDERRERGRDQHHHPEGGEHPDPVVERHVQQPP
jgi:hypothetical protein